MKPNLIKLVEREAMDFRRRVGLSDSEAVNLRSMLLRLNVLTIYRPLSATFSGMSLKSPDGKRFMLINSSHPVCRQNFTVAHELYHLFVEENPQPHNCAAEGSKNESEQCADAFAQMFLMPAAGVLQLIPAAELPKDRITIGTVIRMEQYFSVSRQAMLNRLFDLDFISRQYREALMAYPVIRTAREYGHDTTLYLPGNDNHVIGDFGERARRLYDEGKISEGHYRELMSKIGIYGDED